jgi:hypothetical protein
VGEEHTEIRLVDTELPLDRRACQADLPPDYACPTGDRCLDVEPLDAVRRLDIAGRDEVANGSAGHAGLCRSAQTRGGLTLGWITCGYLRHDNQRSASTGRAARSIAMSMS